MDLPLVLCPLRAWLSSMRRRCFVKYVHYRKSRRWSGMRWLVERCSLYYLGFSTSPEETAIHGLYDGLESARNPVRASHWRSFD